jgi:hypothetical protein
MSRETDDILTDLRAVAGELHPYTAPSMFSLTHTQMALAILFRREDDLLREQIKELRAEVAELRKLLAPPPPTPDQVLGISSIPEDCA